MVSLRGQSGSLAKTVGVCSITETTQVPIWSEVTDSCSRYSNSREDAGEQDVDGVIEFYYTVSDCLIILRLLGYDSDLYIVTLNAMLLDACQQGC